MRTIIKNIFIAVLFTGIFTGCRDYVEIDLVGQRELKYTEDYQNILNTSIQVEGSFYYPLLASDDVYSSDEAYLNRLYTADANTYIWNDDIVGDNTEDTDWQRLYSQIYKFNTIIHDILDSKEGTEAEKKSIMAQAKVHRALDYFYLVNIYAKQYDGATAASELGVPHLLEPDLYASLDRKPIQAIYDQIIADLTNAIPDLPEKANFNVLASQTAARGILARVYLQMKNYEEALKYADETLASQKELIDLNNYVNVPNTYPNIIGDPEEIFIKSLGNSYPTVPINPELLNLFEEGDLRKQLFTADGSVFGYNSFVGSGYNKHRIIQTNGKVTNGPSVPEMMLIKAEALARDNSRFREAESILNALRIKRFKVAAYQPLELSSQENVLKEVINERRKELMCKGLRWFDQKRLANEEGFVTTQTRTYKGATYTLEPNSNRYVFPIATKYMVLNPEIVQNPR